MQMCLLKELLNCTHPAQELCELGQEIHFSFLVALGSLHWSWVELSTGLDQGQLPCQIIIFFGLTVCSVPHNQSKFTDGLLSLCECLLHEKRKVVLKWHQGWEVTDMEMEGLLRVCSTV